MPLVERLVPKDRERQSSQVSEQKYHQQCDHQQIQAKLNIAPQSSTEQGDTNDMKMIISKEGTASPATSVSSTKDNDMIDKIINQRIVIKDSDFLSSSKQQELYSSSAEQYECFSSKVSDSKGDSSRNQDTRLIDLDTSVLRDTATICDDSSKCTEYDTSQGTSNVLDTYSNQFSQDDTRFLSTVSSKHIGKHMRKSCLFRQRDFSNSVEETRGEEVSAIQVSDTERLELVEPIEMRDSAPSFVEDVACEEKGKDLLNRYCTFGELTLHTAKVINTEGKHTTELLQGSAIRSGGKYAQMIKFGIPKEAIAHAMMRDSALTQESSNAVKINKGENSINEIVQSAKSHTTEEVRSEKTNVSPLKEDHDCNKYIKMLKMGLPLGAVENAMKRDGKDPSVLSSVSTVCADTEYQVTPFVKKVGKDMYRRTRLHWVEVSSAQNSVWDWVKNDDDVGQFEIDEAEFSALFQLEKQTNGYTNRAKETPPKSAVKVIDSKRANNGGIILARLKMSYSQIARAIETMDERHFNVEQIKGIMEYIPTTDEILALQRYTHSLQSIEHDQLCECEKFMVSMIPVADAKKKMQYMLFKLTFPPSINELQTEMRIVLKACNEVLGSLNLRKVLGIILKVGNRLNSSGVENEKCYVDGFTIDTLSKLSQIKAFDRKTTLLFYIVSLIQRSNESLLCIKQDIPHVFEAQKINLNHGTRLAALTSQLLDVKKTALEEAHKVISDCKDTGKDEEEETLLQSCRVGVFTLQATQMLSSLHKISNEVSMKFSSVIAYFAQEKEITQSMLFSIIGSFSLEVDFVLAELMSKKVVKKRFFCQSQTERKQMPNAEVLISED